MHYFEWEFCVPFARRFSRT